jgi:UPF0755 protein
MKKFFTWSFGVVVLLACLAVAWLMVDFNAFRENQVAAGTEEIAIDIAPGSSLRTISKQLAADGVITHPLYLVVLGRYLGLDNKIKAGEYHVPGDVNPEQLLQYLTSGKVIQHELALIEGETFKQLIVRIQASKYLTHTLDDINPQTVMTAIGQPDMHPEGRFLPETYHFPRGMTDVEFLKRAFLAMENFLAKEWPGREKGIPIKSPYEALILASIVEKETGKPEERPRIAGVFTRRLKQGMRLQTDPTIIYGMGDSYDGDIRYRDLRTDTPYNTYTRGGLTPTPIAMPGKAAIRAVLHPLDEGELYFVARGDGKHQFSKTLREHNNAVNRYQKKKR